MRTSKNDIDAYYFAGDASGLSTMSMVDYLNLKLRHVDSTEAGGTSYLIHVAHAAEAIAAGKCNRRPDHACRSAALGRIERCGAARHRRRVAGSAMGGAVQRDDGQPLRVGAMRHMHEYGTTTEQLAAVKVAASLHAQYNPKAMLRGVVTMDDVLAHP